MSLHRIISLAKATNGQYTLGRPWAIVMLWQVISLLIIQNPLMRSSRLRVGILRAFGARLGHGLVMRDVKIHLPWRLEIGDNTWIGERVYLHNQALIKIGRDCVISQEVFITTGSHDSRRTMDLVLRPVVIDSGSWVTSRSVVLAGAHILEGALITPGSVVRGEVEAHWIYTGNPAVPIREREYSEL